MKKMLDKKACLWYHNRAHPNLGGAYLYWIRQNLEKTSKSFKKGIDKRGEMWYTVKVAAIVVTEMILENWTTREKYKAYKVCVTDLEQF